MFRQGVYPLPSLQSHLKFDLGELPGNVSRSFHFLDPAPFHAFLRFDSVGLSRSFFFFLSAQMFAAAISS